MSYERIGDTKYVDGKKFTLVAQTESHEHFSEKNSVPGASKLHPALRNPRWKIDNDTVQKNKWALAQKKEIENLKKNIDFIFTMDDYKNYVNAIMYLQENLGTTVTGEYDIRTAQFIFSLLKERYKEISPYLKYHGAFGFPHVYGVDKNLWGLLKLNPKALAPDDDIVWVSGAIRIQSEEYKKRLPIDAVPENIRRSLNLYFDIFKPFETENVKYTLRYKVINGKYICEYYEKNPTPDYKLFSKPEKTHIVHYFWIEFKSIDELAKEVWEILEKILGRNITMDALGEVTSNIDPSALASVLQFNFEVSITPNAATMLLAIISVVLALLPDSSKKEIYLLELFQEFRDEQRVPVCVGRRSTYINFEDVTDDYPFYP